MATSCEAEKRLRASMRPASPAMSSGEERAAAARQVAARADMEAVNQNLKWRRLSCLLLRYSGTGTAIMGGWKGLPLGSRGLDEGGVEGFADPGQKEELHGADGEVR